MKEMDERVNEGDQMSEQVQTNGRTTVETRGWEGELVIVQPDEDIGRVEQIAEQLDGMRPVLAVFLGGTGHLMALHLKVLLTARFGKSWQKKIRILVFDTTDEPYAVRLAGRTIRLEPGAEFFNIGNVPVARIKRNIDNLESIGERFQGVLDRLPAMSLRNGAKSVPPLGLLAFYWHFSTIYDELRNALWTLAGRDQDDARVALQQQGINTIIGGSFVGGTSSGIALDVAALIRAEFEDLGAQEDFCHITGVAVLPQAFPGIPRTNLYANTGASLQEVNHLMVNGAFSAPYPDGRVVELQQAPFDLLYVLDGVDERGRAWSGIAEVTAMAAKGIYLQMASQLGRRGDNVFDNLDEILMGRTPEGEGTFLASYGLGYLEFPAPEVAELCTRRLLAELITGRWLAAPAGESDDGQPMQRLQAITPRQLGSRLLRDDEGGDLRVTLRQPGWLKNKRHDEVAAAAKAYVREYGYARVGKELLPKVAHHASTCSEQQRERWQAWVAMTLFAPDSTLPTVLSDLQRARTQLVGWLDENRGRLAELEKMEAAAETVTHKEAALVQAAGSLFIGRAGRIQEALDGYFQAAAEWYELQLQVAQVQGRRQVWSQLSDHLQALAQRVGMLADRLEAMAPRLQNDVQARQQAMQQRGVSRFSLADEGYLNELYEAHKPEAVNLPAQLEDVTALELANLSSDRLQETLLSALREQFAAVRQMDIEMVIEARSGEMSPRARRQHLFRLATPSWSIDRARLPEGGNGLVRIEVLGVPTVNDTLFDDETTLVSTHDPYRLVAFVVVAGAPITALQQYGRYMQMMEEVQRQRPIHVLPHFLADAGRVKLAFALGSIFGFIYSQGTYFYYQPSDELKQPRRLENGLANAIATLETDEALVREIMERVDAQIARLGLQRAIQVLTDYYSAAPEGRTSVDDLARELKQQVRDYTEELRQISDFSRGLNS
ncbi:MAG: tubulin-like doman-containing protein [Chloroflexota bacterium]